MNFPRPEKEPAGKVLRELLNLPHEAKVAQGIVHTPQEIAQQPTTWVSTHLLFEKRRGEIGEFLSAAGVWDDVARRPTVWLIGAGTSDYVGQSLMHLLRRRWQCEVIAVPSTDLLTHVDDYVIPGRRYLWVSFSRSGDSPEGVALLERAAERYPDIYQLVISCNQNGRMLRGANGQKNRLAVCLDDAVNDRGLAMTSSFSNMVVFGQCLAHIRNGDEYHAVLRQLVGAGETFLGIASDCAAELASGSYRKACFVGSGALKAAARESALKVLELTAGNIQTMSESSLGLRHGPMAALDRETLFVAFVTGDERVQRYDKDLLTEIGRKQVVETRVAIGLSCENQSNRLAERCLTWPPTLAVSDHYRPPVDAIFGQLLGLFFSLNCRLQPDCPSPSGVISRVVQNVVIHP
jgi:tagatose-6-phosphate ketose/aldose isomerase